MSMNVQSRLIVYNIQIIYLYTDLPYHYELFTFGQFLSALTSGLVAN